MEDSQRTVEEGSNGERVCVEELKTERDSEEEWVKVFLTDKGVQGVLCGCRNGDRTQREGEDNCEASDDREMHCSSNCDRCYDSVEEAFEQTESRVQEGNTHNGQSDESDDVSVITDSELEAKEMSGKLDEICTFRGSMCGPLRVLERPVQRGPEVHKDGEKVTGIPLQIVIICSLGILMGVAASRIYSVADTCWVSNGFDLETIRAESNNLINHIKELGEVKKFIDRLKESIPDARKTPRYSRRKHSRSSESKKEAGSSNEDSFEPTSATIGKLQGSLDSLSRVIDEVNDTNELFDTEIEQTRSITSNLSAFHSIVASLARRIGESDKPLEHSFLQSANDRIKRVSRCLLSDLTEAMYDLTTNAYSKFSKLSYKLSRQLCDLRRSVPEGEGFLRELDENNSFLSPCDELCDESRPRKKRRGSRKKHACRNSNEAHRESSSEKILPENERDRVLWESELVCPARESHSVFPAKGSINSNNDSRTESSNRSRTTAESIQEGEHCVNYATIETPRDESSSEIDERSSVGDELFKDPMESPSYDKKRRKSESRSGVAEKKRTKSKGSSKGSSKSKKRSLKERESEQSSWQVPSADWQFKRSHSREKQRTPSGEDSGFGERANWYLDRANYRRKAREQTQSNEINEMKGTNFRDSANCDSRAEISGYEEDFLASDWLDRKQANPRRHGSSSRGSKNERRSHRKNIAQTRRR